MYLFFNCDHMHMLPRLKTDGTLTFTKMRLRNPLYYYVKSEDTFYTFLVVSDKPNRVGIVYPPKIKQDSFSHIRPPKGANIIVFISKNEFFKPTLSTVLNFSVDGLDNGYIFYNVDTCEQYSMYNLFGNWISTDGIVSRLYNKDDVYIGQTAYGLYTSKNTNICDDVFHVNGKYYVITDYGETLALNQHLLHRVIGSLISKGYRRVI